MESASHAQRHRRHRLFSSGGVVHQPDGPLVNILSLSKHEVPLRQVTLPLRLKPDPNIAHGLSAETV
ncbi:MAG: hypothetical protein ACLQU3_22830 [Limisphaerales bacterium]